MRYFGWVAALAVFLLLGALGCGKGPDSVRLTDIVPLTTDTLADLLLGEPDAPATRTSPLDRPLLAKGVFESVALASDVQGFADVSRGALTRDDVQNLNHQVVERLRKRLQRHGFTATEASYPPQVTMDRALVATLTPQIQEGGSTEDRAKGRGKTLILVRLTITDPKSGRVLAQRDYYSGADAKNGADGSSARHWRRYR